MDLVAPPNVEVALVSALSEVLAAHVCTRYPTNDEGLPVVRVSAVGGEVNRLVLARSRVLVECWSDDESDAWYLAARAHAYLCELAGTVAGVTVYRVEADLPVNFPDTGRLSRFRFQFVAQIFARMETV